MNGEVAMGAAGLRGVTEAYPCSSMCATSRATYEETRSTFSVHGALV